MRAPDGVYNCFKLLSPTTSDETRVTRVNL